MGLFFEENDTNDEEIFDVSRKLVMDNVDRTIKDVLNEIPEGKININPDYQRNYVWNTVQSSKLIESILINIPIPNIYLSQTMNGTWEVIDGVQRLTTLKNFYDGVYELKGLEVLPELNRKKYEDLSEEIRNYLDDKIIRYVRIKNESSEDIKFDVFMRLNQGSVKLNEQELRNCLYRGELNDLLKRISDSSVNYNDLLSVRAESSVKVRMKTVELLLRMLAFDEAYEENFQNYSGRIKKQLNDYMFRNQNDIVGVEEKLLKGINNLHTIFDGKEERPFRLKSENIINLSLSETQLVIASKLEEGYDASAVYDVFMDCLSDALFVDHLKNATGNTTRVKFRYEFLTSKTKRRRYRYCMNELKLLSESYDSENEDIYLKAFYGMAISKIEFYLHVYYNELTEKSLSFFINKMSENEHYRCNTIKRLASKLSTMTIKEDNLKHQELLKLFVYIIDEDYEKIISLNFENVKENLYGNYSQLPQNVDKINDISKEFYNTELFVVFDITESKEINGLKVDTVETIDLKRIFHEIYDRRQKCLHLDQLKAIDFNRLETHRKAIGIILEKVEELNSNIENCM